VDELSCAMTGAYVMYFVKLVLSRV